MQGKTKKKFQKKFFLPIITKLISKTKSLKKFFDLTKFLLNKMLPAFRFIAQNKVVQPAQILRYSREN